MSDEVKALTAEEEAKMRASLGYAGSYGPACVSYLFATLDDARQRIAALEAERDAAFARGKAEGRREGIEEAAAIFSGEAQMLREKIRVWRAEGTPVERATLPYLASLALRADKCAEGIRALSPAAEQEKAGEPVYRLVRPDAVEIIAKVLGARVSFSEDGLKSVAVDIWHALFTPLTAKNVPSPDWKARALAAEQERDRLRRLCAAAGFEIGVLAESGASPQQLGDLRDRFFAALSEAPTDGK